MERPPDGEGLYTPPPPFILDPERRIDLAPNPIFLPENLGRLQAIRDADIPYAIYSGAHVALLTGRPADDIDVMIKENDYDRLRNLDAFDRAQAYELWPLPHLWPNDEPEQPAKFLAIDDLEIRAGSDNTPGYFTCTDFVLEHSTLEVIKIDKRWQAEVILAPISETFLFKLAMWRRKDITDIYDLLKYGVHLHEPYLSRRIKETRTEDQITNRFDMLIAMLEDIMRAASNPEDLEDSVDHNIGVIAHFTRYRT